jgi:hypothetical protein
MCVVISFRGLTGRSEPASGFRHVETRASGLTYVRERKDAMKYVVLIYSNPDLWETLPKEQSSRIIGEHYRVIDELTRSGELLMQFGLADAALTRTMRLTDGAPVVTDGPFSEAKEQLAGVFVVDCENVDRVLEFSMPLAQQSVIEVRPLYTESGTEM